MTPAELREWREAHGLTRGQLAALLSTEERRLTAQAILQWEAPPGAKHARTPPPYLWRALRDVETYG